MAEARQVDDVERQISGHVVVIEVENLESLELGELSREGAIEDIVGQVEEPQPRNRRDLGRNRTRELVISDGEIRQEPEVSQVRRESAGEVQSREVQGGHVATRVARDMCPRAVTGGGVPVG